MVQGRGGQRFTKEKEEFEEFKEPAAVYSKTGYESVS
jgi:hypothetical protein